MCLRPEARQQAALASESWLRKAAAAAVRVMARRIQQLRETPLRGNSGGARTRQLASRRLPSGSMRPQRQEKLAARQDQDHTSQALLQLPLRCK